MAISIFDAFTNQYSLSKTLRFELKPIGETQKKLEDLKVFEIDKTIQKKYEATNPYFDRLHREFVKESLENASLSELNTEYLDLFKQYKSDKKSKEKQKALQNKEKKMREEVVKFFDAQGKVWAEKYTGLKNKDIKILFEEAVFESILQKRYGHEKETNIIDDSLGSIIPVFVSIFSSWKNWTGYFGKFFETRRNFYKDDGTSTALATRIVDQNLKRFCDNLLLFENIKNKVNFGEVEQKFGKPFSEIFSLEFYNSCLLQDGIDFYNKILGGETLPNGEKLKGLNECINLHKQQIGDKLPFFKPLDKQILSEKEKIFIDEIKDDSELLNTLKNFYASAEKRTSILKTLFKDFIDHQEKYDLSQIYLSKEAFNTLSRKWTGETDVFEKNLFEILKKEKIISSSAKKKDGGYSFLEFIALSYLKETFQKISAEKFWKEKYYKNEDTSSKGFLNLTNKENIWNQFLQIFEFEFFTLFEKEVLDPETGKISKIGYNSAKNDIEKFFNDFRITPESKIIVKYFADSMLTIYQMAKYFAVEKKRAWNTDYELDVFYTDPSFGYLEFYKDAYEEIVQVYNKLRNYLTKKLYCEEKWKLNFDNSTLANGWDKNKEADNFALILRKDGKYFLGIMTKGHNTLFSDRLAKKFKENLEEGKYEKMVYKFFPDQAKMFPKVCFSAKGLEFFQPSEEIWNIYKNSEFKKGKTFSIQSMQKLIDFYKDCLNKYERMEVL